MVAFNVPVPSTVVPFIKDTVLKGLPPYSPITVAVKVTLPPNVDGFGADFSVVAVVALTTVSVKTGDVLDAKPVAPE